MKNLNALNKFYLFVIAGLIVAIMVKMSNYKAWQRSYYTATVTAPPTFPVRVQVCNFILADNDEFFASHNDVDKHVVQWGYGDLGEPNERTPLPVKLVLNYDSYRDNRNYQDTITLPAARIENIFKTAEAKHIQVGFDTRNGINYGLAFLIGIANGGDIIVWLKGDNYYHEVLLKHTITKSTILNAADRDDAFKYMDSALLKQIALGVDKHARYIDSPLIYR